MRKGRFRFPLCGWRRVSSVAPLAGRQVKSGSGRRARGFTLLELLVALVLFGLIAVLLLGGLRFGARVWEAGVASNERAFEVQMAQTFIRRQLSRARAPVPVEGRESPYFPFEGTREAVGFVSTLPAHLSVGGLHRLSFYVTEASGRKRLMVSWRLLQDEADGGAQNDGEEFLLLDRVEGVEFSYLGRDKEGEPGWRESWEDEQRLPALVRMRVEFGEGDGRYWPELVIAPRIESNP